MRSGEECFNHMATIVLDRVGDSHVILIASGPVLWVGVTLTRGYLASMCYANMV
jgi:hypothetical protein